MKQLIIFGTGAFAEVAHFYFNHDSLYSVEAFCADTQFIRQAEFKGLPVLPFQDVEKSFSPAEFELFVAIGYTKLNRNRAAKCKEAQEKGYRLASYVSSRISALQTPQLGQNCFIFEDNTIQPFTRFGDNVIMWSGNHIGHHTVIGNDCFITSHVCIGGGSVIEDACFIGMNATIRDGIKIGRQCIIGAGALILKDTKPNEVYSVAGTKAREITSDQIDL